MDPDPLSSGRRPGWIHSERPMSLIAIPPAGAGLFHEGMWKGDER